MNSEFVFSVIRVVPDPVKDEAVNIGVVVLESEGLGGDVVFNRHFKSRVAGLKKDYPVQAAIAALEELRGFLGLSAQPHLGQVLSTRNATARLSAATRSLEGQLQLTEPKRYRAESLSRAVRQLYKRYVAQKLPSAREVRQPSVGEMRTRIWQTIQRWQEPNVYVERNAVIRGREARHGADFVLKNGVPHAAIFALPALDTERSVNFLYRDSLPTIAQDVEAEYPEFKVVGVLPDIDEGTPEAVRAFIDETHALLASYAAISTVSMSELSDLRGELVHRML